MNNEISQHWTLDEEKLAAFILQKIDQKEMSHLTAHLETCSECRKRVQEERELHAGIRKYGRAEMKRKLKLRLRRDQQRRFEWTNVASLAAAIVIMIGGVFVTRWLIDFNQDKPKSREILLSEYKENEPGKQPLWIIGKVIEVSEKSEPRKDIAFADEINPEVKARKEISLSETSGKGKLESEKKDTSLPAASYGNIAANDQEIADRKQENALARATVPSELQKKSKTSSADKTDNQAGYDSIVEASSKPTVLKENPRTVAETKPEQDEFTLRKRPSSYITKQRHLLKNVIVRRGDMKDLPASMNSGDITAIHTRMERTAQGILLTFYSNSIKDTVATNVEAITQDSIIVSFRKKQIVYHIPGGISSGM
jgi:hypothetical protein